MPRFDKKAFRIILLGFFLFSSFKSYSFAAIPSEVTLSQAVELYYKGDFEASLAMLREVVARDPEDRSSRVNLVRLLRETGAMDEAILHLQSLLAETPEDTRLQIALKSAAYLAARLDWVLGTTSKVPEVDYWHGLALMDLGQDSEARQVLERLTTSIEFYPTAFASLGEIALRQGDYTAAEAYLQKALTQEPNLTSALLPLAKTSIGLNKYHNAYRYLLRAKAIAPWDSSIPRLIQDLTEDYPDLVPSSTSPERETPSTDFTVPTVSHWPSRRSELPEVGIGLVEETHQVLIKTGDRFRLMKGRHRKMSGAGQTVLRIRWNSEAIEVYDLKSRLRVKSTTPLRLTYKNPGATTVLFDVDFGKGSFGSGKENRIYRGIFEFLPMKKGMTVVNRLNIEEYLYAVVPSEVSAKWPRAVLEAQAIAARTYAFANLGKSPKRGFDLYGSVASQAYNGIRSENTTTSNAVDATQGLILTYNDRPIGAFYSANSGGYSETSRTVWGLDLPYLKASPDPQLSFDVGQLSPESLASWLNHRPKTYSNNPSYSARSAYRWSLWLPRETIERRLAEENLGRIISIISVGRSRSGRVERLRIRGENREIILPGTVVRSKLGLRSTLFIIEPKLDPEGLPEAFLLTGAGWGHGVGMCQSGAAGMAADGYISTAILSHYYPGATLTEAY